MKSKTNNNEQSFWSRVSKKLEESQRAVALYLGEQCDKLSLQGRKWTFLFFGLMMAGVCLSLIVKPFRDVSSNIKVLSSGSITIVPIQNTNSVFSQQDFFTLLKFKRSMDSLKQVNPAAYNDILKDRQRLMDSVNFLIEIYR